MKECEYRGKKIKETDTHIRYECGAVYEGLSSVLSLCENFDKFNNTCMVPKELSDRAKAKMRRLM